MKLSILTRIGATVAIAAGLVFGAAPAQAAAAAAPVSTVSSVTASQQGSVATVVKPDYDPGSTESVCGTSATGAGQSPLLPVARWADATSNMHSRLDGGILTDSAELMQRNGVISAGMGTGNFMWNLGTGMAQFAINFCIMNSAGGAADQIGANIGKALLSPSSGVIAGIVVIVAVIFLARGMRRGSVQWKNLMMKGVIVGLFAVMVAGASASTGGGRDGSPDPYKPGVLSPGWIITGMNKAVGSLASAPAAAMSLDSGGAGDLSNDPISCANYLTSMKQQYIDRYGSGGSQLSSGVPLILSGMWEKAGLTTWRTAQFNSINSGLDANVYCHVLEHNAGSTVQGFEAGTVQSIMIGIMNGNTPSSSSEVWKSSAFAPTDNVRKDRSAVAWSVCSLVNPGTSAGLETAGAWKMSDKWAGIKSDKNVDAEDCRKFFAKDNDSLDAFDWPSNGEETSKNAAGNADVRNFVRTLHGNDNSQGITSVLAYNLSAGGMMVVFGAIAAAIIVAKIAMVLMIIIIFFMLLAALSPTADMGKLGGALKTILGMNVFVFLVQLIFAFVAVFTKLLQDVGGVLMGGDTSLVATVWSGLAPLMAVGIMHMMFTKIMKVPSPFSISGGLSWGSMMGGAMGGAAFTGVSSLLDRTQSRLKSRATGAAKGAASSAVGSGKSAMSSLAGKATGGRIGGGTVRKGAANPAEAGKAGAAAGKSRAGSADVTASDLLSGQNGDGAPQIDHTGLASSGIKNSQLTKGAQTPQERAVMKTAADEELKAAIQHEKDQKAALGIVEPTSAVGKAKDRLAQVRSDFKERPLHTIGAITASTAKVGMKGAKYAAIGGLAATGVGVVPAAAILAGTAVMKHGYKNSDRGQRALNDERVANYRNHILKTRSAEKEALKNSGGQAPAEPRKGSGTVTEAVAPNTLGSTGAQGANNAPVVRTTSAQPKTAPLPVTPSQPAQAPRVVRTNPDSAPATVQQPAQPRPAQVRPTTPAQAPRTTQAPAPVRPAAPVRTAPAREPVAPPRPSGPAGQ
jgi:hypothetical protein